MSNFKGYYMEINGCKFRNPQIARDKWRFQPKLVQVTDEGQTASGKLVIKVLPHTRSKIYIGFPPMLPEQFRVYWKALKGNEAGEGMYLTVKAYDDATDSYIEDVYYHNDLGYKVAYYNKRRYIIMDDFNLIGH